MEISILVEELDNNKKHFEEHETKFIESLCKFYYKAGFLTVKQEKWARIYYSNLKRIKENFYAETIK